MTLIEQRKVSRLGRGGSSVDGSLQDNSVWLYDPMNAETGTFEGTVTLDSIPPMDALLELDEMSIAELEVALKADGIAKVVVIRPEEETNFSSLTDAAFRNN